MYDQEKGSRSVRGHNRTYCPRKTNRPGVTKAPKVVRGNNVVGGEGGEGVIGPQVLLVGSWIVVVESPFRLGGRDTLGLRIGYY